MPQYLSPGVYVEEVDAGPKPIEGVSTSTAGAVGVTARGPDTGKPLLVTSFGEFLRKFGGPIIVDAATRARWSDDPEKGEFWNFHLAVKGFFDNGGQNLYVRRVVSKGALPASVTLGQGQVAYVTGNALDTDKVLKLESLVGIEKGTVLSLNIDGVASNVTVDAYDRVAGTVTLTANLPRRVQAGRDFVQFTIAKGATFKLSAKSVGEWGNTLSARALPTEAAQYALMADPSIATNSPASTTVAANVDADDKFDVANPAGFATNDWVLVDGKQFRITVAGTKFTLTIPLGNSSWKQGTAVVKDLDPNGATRTTIAADIQGDTIELEDATNFANNDRVNIAGTFYRLSNKTATAGNKATVKLARILPFRQGSSVVRVRFAANVAMATAQSLFVWGASSLYENAFVEIEDTGKSEKHYGRVTKVTGNKVDITLEAAPAAAFRLLEGQRIKLIEGKLFVSYAPKEGQPTFEEIDNLRMNPAEPDDPMYFVNRVGAVSQLVKAELVKIVAPPTLPIAKLEEFPAAVDDPTAPNPTGITWAKLASGNDDFGGLTVDEFVGLDQGPGKRTGIQALEDIDDISITIAPSIWSSLVHNALIQQAEILKYRFAIIDPRPVKPTDDDVIGKIRAFREGFDTKYGAVYFPRIQVRDPFTSTTIGLGPSGHLAGLYARIDIERGVHKAPANEVIRGIDTANGFHGLEIEITKREQDQLNPKGINALRFFPNRNTRVWGARTLSSDGSWKYINVRRIFIYVERSIDEGTQWVVFEPNDEKTWARVRQTITNFLVSTWRAGMLFGTKQEEAFFVRCDRTTMTQDDIDNGRLICVIGIAPVKPAEFVIFRIQQKLIDQKEP